LVCGTNTVGTPANSSSWRGVEARGADGSVDAEQVLAEARLGPPRQPRTAARRAAKQRPGGEHQVELRVVGQQLACPLEQLLRARVAAPARGDQHAAGALGHAEGLPGLGTRSQLEALGSHDRAGEGDAARVEAELGDALVGESGDDDAVVEAGDRAKGRLLADVVLDGSQHQGPVLAQVERAEQLLERAVGEGVDDQEVGPQQRQRVPDPLLGEREVAELGHARGLDDRLARQLERGEALVPQPGVGLRGGQEPVLGGDPGEARVAPQPAVDRHLAGHVPEAAAVDRVADEAEAARQVGHG
jgi:hypothetical protein